MVGVLRRGFGLPKSSPGVNTESVTPSTCSKRSELLMSGVSDSGTRSLQPLDVLCPSIESGPCGSPSPINRPTAHFRSVSLFPCQLTAARRSQSCSNGFRSSTPSRSSDPHNNVPRWWLKSGDGRRCSRSRSPASAHRTVGVSALRCRTERAIRTGPLCRPRTGSAALHVASDC